MRIQFDKTVQRSRLGKSECEKRRNSDLGVTNHSNKHNLHYLERSHGVVVSTQDFEFCDPGSNPGGTFTIVFSRYLVLRVWVICRMATTQLASLSKLLKIPIDSHYDESYIIRLGMGVKGR